MLFMPSTIKDRRIGNDRRCDNYCASFPFLDKNNIMVSYERRVRCERRQDGYEIDESNMSREAFMKYFSESTNKYGQSKIDINSSQTKDIDKTDIFDSCFNLG